MEIRVPKTKMGNRSSEDYFNPDVDRLNAYSSSYIIDDTKIALHNNSKTKVYSLILKSESKDSLFILKFNASKVKAIEFLGKGKDGNFYFKVEQEASCNKMYVTSNYDMFFSEY